MRRSVVTIIISVILVIGVLIIALLNFGKNKESEITKLYDIARDKIIEQANKEAKDLDKKSEYNTFVKMDEYGTKEIDENTQYVYAYVASSSYYKNSDGIVVVDTSFSMPFRFEFQNGEYVGYTVPQDGTYYEESLKEMYPLNIRMKMDFSNKKYDLIHLADIDAATYYGVDVENIKKGE